jgi:hypothetical protein
MSLGLPWGLALTSGVNTYLPLFLLALFARYTHLVNLSPRFQWLVSEQALVILGVKENGGANFRQAIRWDKNKSPAPGPLG